MMRRYWLEGVVAAIVVTSLVLMVTYPHESTVPLHCVWIALTVLYGVRSWGHLPTDAVVAVILAATCAILWHLAVIHAIEAEEIAEAPLTATAFLVTAGFVRRRQRALEASGRLVAQEREARAAQQHLACTACHDVRNPLTVARGYAELIRNRVEDAAVRDDSATVIHEVDRATAIVSRLRADFALVSDRLAQPFPR